MAVCIPPALEREARALCKRIIAQDDASSSEVNGSRITDCRAVLVAIARGFRWRRILDEGRYNSIRNMADDLGTSAPYVSRLIRLSLLAPGIIEAIVEGREPDGISIERLRRPMPLVWEGQRRQAGMTSRAPVLTYR